MDGTNVSLLYKNVLDVDRDCEFACVFSSSISGISNLSNNRYLIYIGETLTIRNCAIEESYEPLCQIDIESGIENVFQLNGKEILVIAGKKSLYFWDLNTYQCIKWFKRIHCEGAFLLDNNKIVILCKNQIILFNTDTMTIEKSIEDKEHNLDYCDLIVLSNNKVLLNGSNFYVVDFEAMKLTVIEKTIELRLTMLNLGEIYSLHEGKTTFYRYEENKKKIEES